MLESVELIAARHGAAHAAGRSAGQLRSALSRRARGDRLVPAGRASVYNLIRGCDPQPGAYTTLKGEKLRLYDARRLDGNYRPGVVEEVSAAGILLGARGGAIRVKRVRFDKAKEDAASFCAAHGVGPGAALA